MIFLGIDLGSSSVKVSVFDASLGRELASSKFPEKEMEILSPEPGFAEQDPELWWSNTEVALDEIHKKDKALLSQVKAIGIAYQMHGLVLVDKQQKILRPSIIWCDSRAVAIGEKAASELGAGYCRHHLLNAPGNFTASKLKWVKENEPELFQKIDKWMLPGDFIAMKFTGEIKSTISGYSEGVFWDYQDNTPGKILLQYYGFEQSIFPELTPAFGNQGTLLPELCLKYGFTKDTIIAYRAGDQSNNAFSLGVYRPGDVAATGGTSGVLYGLSEQPVADAASRINTFAHVNYTSKLPVFGILMCINGAGRAYAWLRNEFFPGIAYEELENLAASVPPGSDGLLFIPFGNGAERILDNTTPGAFFANLDFNRHTKAHMIRACLEGIAFAFAYGMQLMRTSGMPVTEMKAGADNLFQSTVFSQTLSSLMQVKINLISTSGAEGAARGAAVALGYYKNMADAFRTLPIKKEILPEPITSLKASYQEWTNKLNHLTNSNQDL